MMTTAPETGNFQADLPDEVRNRAHFSPEERLERLLSVSGPKLTYAEPQNCALHLLNPPHDVVPSVTTIVGLSLCPRCAFRVGFEVSEHGLSQSELISRALRGRWVE